MSAYKPDRSVMKPMRTTSPEIWACAGTANSPAAVIAQAVEIWVSFICIS